MLNDLLPTLIGHRGITSLAPENTLGGIRCAHRHGVRWVELDTTLLADGTPVISHDDDLDRLALRPERLSQLTSVRAADLNMAAHCFDWKQREPLPTLADTLALLNELEMGLNLEIKEFGLDPHWVVSRIAPELARFDPARLVISSFSEPLLEQCHALLPQFRRGLLTSRLPADWAQRLQALEAYSVHLQWQKVDAETVAQLHAAGYVVLCWTVNDLDAAQRLLQWGVASLISDRPQELAIRLAPGR